MRPDELIRAAVIPFLILFTGSVAAQQVLPFPPPPMGGKVGLTMQESVYKWRPQPHHLPEDAPNILIVMLDDAGYGQASTFGGEIETPTLSRLAEQGIAYNAFHTTAMCSPTRAALLTGRNHNRVGFGQIAELANDWDGYTGIIPKSSATIAEVFGHYGYATVADAYFEKAPFAFEGRLNRLHFKNLQVERPAFKRSPDDD